MLGSEEALLVFFTSTSPLNRLKTSLPPRQPDWKHINNQEGASPYPCLDLYREHACVTHAWVLESRYSMLLGAEWGLVRIGVVTTHHANPNFQPVFAGVSDDTRRPIVQSSRSAVVQLSRSPVGGK